MNEERPIELDGEGNRHKAKYFEKNFYIIITDRSFDLTFSSNDKSKVEDRTKVGMGIISRLATRLLEDDCDLEDLAGMFFSESMKKGDLADTLAKAVETEINLIGKP